MDRSPCHLLVPCWRQNHPCLLCHCLFHLSSNRFRVSSSHLHQSSNRFRGNSNRCCYCYCYCCCPRSCCCYCCCPSRFHLCRSYPNLCRPCRHLFHLCRLFLPFRRHRLCHPCP